MNWSHQFLGICESWCIFVYFCYNLIFFLIIYGKNFFNEIAQIGTYHKIPTATFKNDC